MKSTTSDKIGIVASLLCLVHCLALPVLFTISADTLLLVNHEYPFIDYLFALVALIAAFLSARKTKNRRIKIAFAIGWTFFIVGVLFHENPLLFLLLHLGSLVLIITHLQNIRSCSIKNKKIRR